MLVGLENRAPHRSPPMAAETPVQPTVPAAQHTPEKKPGKKPAKKAAPAATAKKAAPVAKGRKNGKKPQRAAAKAKQTGRGRPAAEVTSKADLIRKVAGIIKAKGEKPRPADIVRILGEEGVAVSAAQVSQTLKAAGYRPLRKRRKGRKAAAANASGKATATGAKPISVDDLLAAKSVSGAFGGTDQAIAVLQALKRIER